MIGDIAAITAAVAFAVLVIFLAVPLWKLGAAVSYTHLTLPTNREV